ncbi:MAG: hypothetical protein Q4G21_07515 [Dermabacter sp.]|nr:hypothetical protein [Dermabacter sp.]
MSPSSPRPTLSDLAAPGAKEKRRSLRGAPARACARLTARLRSDQGDVPGWVLITLMTAGIVVALWAVASPALISLFNQAIGEFSR